MGPTAQLCSHRLHSVATFERRSHCPVAPAVLLHVVIGTVDTGQYSYICYQSADETERKKDMSRHGWRGRGADELTSRYFAR